MNCIKIIVKGIHFLAPLYADKLVELITAEFEKEIEKYIESL